MINKTTKSFKFIVAGIEAGIILSICWYVLRTLFLNFEQLELSDGGFRPLFLVYSFPFAISYLLGRGLIWHLMADKIIGAHEARLNILVWLGSVIGKYLPGKVFLLLGRMHFYRDIGASKKKIGFCFLMEVCCSILAASTTFLISLGLRGGGKEMKFLVPVLSTAVLLLLLTHPAVLRRLFKVYCKLFKRPFVEFQLRWSSILFWIILMVSNWLVLGMGFYLLLSSIAPISFHLMPYLTGSFALAGVIGLLVVFAPSGIGVREAVMMTALVLVLPKGMAAAGTILARIWITLAELACSLAALFMLKCSRGSQR